MNREVLEFLPPMTVASVVALFVIGIIAYLVVRLSNGQANKLSQRWPIFVLRGLVLLTLLAVMFNPVWVARHEGSIEPARVFFLLDASESMAIGEASKTRWDNAIDRIQSGVNSAYQTAAAEVSLFRFGRRLSAVTSPKSIGLTDSLAPESGRGVSFSTKDDKEDSTTENEDATQQHAATDSDTQLMVALQQITSRFGRKPPASVVVFSDGRARDKSLIPQVARSFSDLEIPIHTVPLGDTSGNGDIAVVSMIVPATARKRSTVIGQAFLRSYGFEGQRVTVQLDSIDENKKRLNRLASVSVVLENGFQPVPISFQTEDNTELLEVSVTPLPTEVSKENNRFESEIDLSRQKIRVLYFEGSQIPNIPTTVDGRVVFRGPTSPLSNALVSDPDIECIPIQVAVDQVRGDGSATYPNSASTLSAFDAVILSDVPKSTFSEQQLEWIESWVRLRGGGLCMLGGRNSFGAGGWAGSPIAKVLPVGFGDEFDFGNDVRVAMEVNAEGPTHPILKLTGTKLKNREILSAFPSFIGANVKLLPKPNLAEVLSVGHADGKVKLQQVQQASPSPLFSTQGVRNLFKPAAKALKVETPDEFASITVGKYGKGRSMAMAMPITGQPAEHFVKWGSAANNNDYYSGFWRNAICWLTERSWVGRRRLIAQCDKRYYGPDQVITLSGSAFEESSKRTSRYRLVATIEPQSFDGIESDFSFIRWPNNVPREEEVGSPFLIWGEEFEIPVKQIGGVEQYQVELAIAETLPPGIANQTLRVELTAYDDGSQVDSTSVPIQILHDPFEQQNPFPDHESLNQLANASGGKVLENDQALADMLTSLPIERGPAGFSRTPIWSQWWVMALIVGLISSEWCYRRWIGLA